MQEPKEKPQEKDFAKELQRIRIGFMERGISLNKFCGQNGIDYANARKSILRLKNGEKARALRQYILEASQGKHPINCNEAI
jgi:hypothetical protein